jgi:RNA polymerase sigma-70 factor (ECF subfamily)
MQLTLPALIKKRKRKMHHKGKAYMVATWSRFKSGDRYAFEEICSEFIDDLFAYGIKISNNRELVKDSIQDLFIDLYRYKIDLKKPESMEFYLFKSLKRIILKKLKKNRKTESFEETDSVEFDLTLDIEQRFIQLESDMVIRQKMQQVLNDLKPKSRELLFYKFNSNLSYEEIGKLTGLKPDSAKKQIYRIVKRLREDYRIKIPVN